MDGGGIEGCILEAYDGTTLPEVIRPSAETLLASRANSLVDAGTSSSMRFRFLAFGFGASRLKCKATGDAASCWLKTTRRHDTRLTKAASELRRALQGQQHGFRPWQKSPSSSLHPYLRLIGPHWWAP